MLTSRSMGSQSARPAVHAGRWYPADARTLEREIDEYLNRARITTASGGAPEPAPLGDLVALIVPHAGLRYSGPVAAFAYLRLARHVFDAIVLVGPSHFDLFDGVALYPGGAFATPLGPLSIDAELGARLADRCPLIKENAWPHLREHSLEMQLPFLRRLLPAVPIVPLLMGRQTPATIHALSAALSEVACRCRVLLVASSDLSHFEDARRAAELDHEVIACVEAFETEGLLALLAANPAHACGGGPIVAVMEAARAMGAVDARVLRYADSGDVSGDKTSVVGYLAAALGRAPVERSSLPDGL